MRFSELQVKNIYDNLVFETMRFFSERKALKSAVLGVSGGIDSTLVACILDDAFRRLNDAGEDGEYTLYGYSLPTSTTDEKEYNVSLAVGNAFTEFTVHSIDRMFIGFMKGFGEDIESNSYDDRLRRGNIKSRMRMIYLYDKAKKHSGCVAGTDNLTEKYLGFSTIGGDGLFDFCPIQNLWKTEVYAVSEYAEKMYRDAGDLSKADALRRSIDMTPMDGLGISSSDMEQIGAECYEDVDDILQSCIEKDLAKEKKIVDRVGEEVYRKVTDRMRRNSFKWKGLPVCIERDYIFDSIDVDRSAIPDSE